MVVDCEGCAGCCIDWRPLADRDIDHERTGPFDPLDDTYNLVPLARDEICRLVEAGYGDALRPRLWRAADDRSVTLDGVDVAAGSRCGGRAGHRPARDHCRGGRRRRAPDARLVTAPRRCILTACRPVCGICTDA